MEETKKKGFTLIELLVTIAILAVVGSITTVIVMNFIKKSKDEANALTEKSIKEAANIYSKEAEVNSWKSSSETDQYEYFCVTVQELVNKGILKNEQIKNSDYPLNRYVSVKRNKATKTIETEEILDKNADDVLQEKCTGAKKVPEGYIPEIKAAVSYTDELQVAVNYKDAYTVITNTVITNTENKDKIVDKYFEYGETSSNLDKSSPISGTISRTSSNKKDTIPNLKNNTDYYIRVCLVTENVKKVCTDTVMYKTLDFVKPSITLGDNITIKYDSTNIKGTINRYFYSGVSGSVTSTVYKCDENFECKSSIRTVEPNNWYRTTSNSIVITATDGNGEIKARIVDKSNNYAEISKEIVVNKVTFVNDDSDRLSSNLNNTEKKCLSEKGGSCEITSPNIPNAKTGYKTIGWNNDSNATVSNWDKNTKKTVSESTTYYTVVTRNPIYVYYYTNKGKITSSAGGYNWTTDSAGLIKRNNDSNFYIVYDDNSSNELGLVNYNNPDYVNITRDGYIAKENEEWNTNANGSGISFNQDTVYTYNDLFNYVSVAGGNYRLNLYVNWVDDINWVDGEPPTCVLTAKNYNGYYVQLTINASDNYDKTSFQYSWTGSSSDYSSTNSKNVSSRGTYTAYVKDNFGNVGSCSGEIGYTYVSQYKATYQTCSKVASKYTCTTNATRNSTSRCGVNYSYNSLTNVCERINNSYLKSCSNYTTKATCNAQPNCNWNLLAFGASGGGTCSTRYGKPATWCTNGTLKNGSCYISHTPFSCSGTISGGQCITYSCSSGTRSGTTCTLTNQSSCSSGWNSTVSDYDYTFSESPGYVYSCYPTSSFDCNSSSVGSSYISNCTPSSYSCSAGYSYINNSYCYRQY